MIARLVKRTLALLLATAVILGAGVGSVWWIIERGSAFSTITIGPWMAWTTAGRPEADPYTRANSQRRALLPLNAAFALTFEATRDSDGKRIHSACEYALDITGLNAQWWSLAVFDDRGQLSRNPAERHTFNTHTLVRDLEGYGLVTLARDARPGNWLPTGDPGPLTLMLTVQDAQWIASVRAQSETPTDKAPPLPEIRRVGCR
jgi:hypothetical protein